MKKIKLFFWIVWFVFVLFIGIVLVVTTLIDANSYKPSIENLVQVTMPLTIRGDLTTARDKLAVDGLLKNKTEAKVTALKQTVTE